LKFYTFSSSLAEAIAREKSIAKVLKLSRFEAYKGHKYAMIRSHLWKL